MGSVEPPWSVLAEELEAFVSQVVGSLREALCVKVPSAFKTVDVEPDVIAREEMMRLQSYGRVAECSGDFQESVEFERRLYADGMADAQQALTNFAAVILYHAFEQEMVAVLR